MVFFISLEDMNKVYSFQKLNKRYAYDIFKTYWYHSYALIEKISFIANYLFAGFQIQGDL